MSTKSIVATVELVPNYLLHLLASARVCFNSEYADTYECSVAPDEISFLRANRASLEWGAGEGGGLGSIVVTMPIVFDLRSVNELDEYFELLTGALSAKSTDRLFSRYSSVIANLERTWFPLRSDALLDLSPLHDQVAAFSQVAKRNFDQYQNHVWPVESRQMNEFALDQNNYVAKRDIVAAWEKLTGKSLVVGTYTILLSSAIKNGPNANSVGYARNIFCSGSSIEWTRDFISHEVGIHLLMSEFRKLSESGKYDWKRLYSANECLAQFLNRIVLDRATLAYDLKQFGSAQLLPAFERAFKGGGKCEYAELIDCAMKMKGN